MIKELHHPTREQIDLSAVLDALSDPIRRQVVRRLADGQQFNCSSFVDLSSKTNLTYHLARLREAGVTRTRIAGPQRFISLRRDDLDARFPGLLDSIIGADG
jgi:DNA-binding transcriptional ArsR family regulator